MAVQLVPRNDYFNMLREGKNINDYDILPLDLSAYSLSETTQRIANNNFMEETTNRNGDYMLSGHWMSLVHVDGYSAYAFSDEQMAVFTYCEGDINLTPFTDRAKYEKEKADTIKFYKEEY